MPAVRPSGSVTRAKCTRERRMASSRSSSDRSRGTTSIRRSNRGGSGRSNTAWSSWSRSLACRNPSTSSMPPAPTTGRREWPWSSTTASASVGVAVAPIQQIWSRGTITEATSRPPKSRTPESSSAAKPWIVPSSREAATMHGELLGGVGAGQLVAGLHAEGPAPRGSPSR